MTQLPMLEESEEDESITVVIEDERWLAMRADVEAQVRDVVARVLEAEEVQGQVAVVLADDAMIRSLNHDFRGKDAPTNVLSFPAKDEEMLGDIILSLDTLTREATEQNKDIWHHTTHLLVHGVLHIIGYDHEDDAEAEEMEAREVALLAGFMISNPYE